MRPPRSGSRQLADAAPRTTATVLCTATPISVSYARVMGIEQRFTSLEDFLASTELTVDGVLDDGADFPYPV